MWTNKKITEPRSGVNLLTGVKSSSPKKSKIFSLFPYKVYNVFSGLS